MFPLKFVAWSLYYNVVRDQEVGMPLESSLPAIEFAIELESYIQLQNDALKFPSAITCLHHHSLLFPNLVWNLRYLSRVMGYYAIYYIFQFFFSLFHKPWSCLLSKTFCSLSCSYTLDFLQNFTDQWPAFFISEVPTFILVFNFVIRYHPWFRHSST